VEDPFDEKKLVEALRTAQPDQLQAAFERHFDAMSRLARGISHRSEADTGRLIETVWRSAVADFAQVNPSGSVRAWLFQRLLDALGPESFEPVDDPWEGHWREFPAPWRAGSQDWEHSPEGRAVLERALDRLPAQERTVLILRDLDGWSSPQVGGLTELMEEDQRDVLFRARLMVRAAMDPMLREPPRPLPAAKEPENNGHD
jgi:RNA polymerase sigma factor (sigma-70 family)